MGRIFLNGQKTEAIMLNGTKYIGSISEILKGKYAPSSVSGANGQVYLQYTDYSNLYTFKEYLEVGSSAGPYINTGYYFTPNDEYEVKCQYTAAPDNDTFVFGDWESMRDTMIGYYGDKHVFSVGGSTYRPDFDTNIHIFKSTHTQMLMDGVDTGIASNWSNYARGWVGLFKHDRHNATKNCRLYYAKIWSNNQLVRHFIPAERNSDNVLGMLDMVNGIFYANNGSGSFTAGSTISSSFNPIIAEYAKVDGSWQNLTGTDISDVKTVENSTDKLAAIGYIDEAHNVQSNRSLVVNGDVLTSTIASSTNCVGIMSIPVVMPDGYDCILVKYKLQAPSYVDEQYYATVFCTDAQDLTLTDKDGAYGNKKLTQRELSSGETDYLYDAIDVPAGRFYLNIQFGCSNFKSIELFAAKVAEVSKPSAVIGSICTINQTQGGVWINTGILASDHEKFLFVFNSVTDDYLMRQVKTSDIAVYTGDTDVYTQIFNSVTIGRDFNVRIYNGYLYVSFNATGSSSHRVSICVPALDVTF